MALRIGGNVDGWYPSDEGSAIPHADDPATRGLFINLQQLVNEYIARYPVTAGTITVDGKIGERTLASTQAVISHIGTGMLVPPNIEFLAYTAADYVDVISKALQKAPDMEAPPGSVPGQGVSMAKVAGVALVALAAWMFLKGERG